MKRSEALKMLELLIRTTRNIDIPNESFYDPKALSEEILDYVENNLGMHPPDEDIMNRWDDEVIKK